MSMPHPVAVIGAGLAGLAAARALTAAGHPVRVLEARDRIGGRALSLPVGTSGDALDLGPAWIWPGAQPALARLIDTLGLDLAPQAEAGDLLFEDADPAIPARRIAYPPRYGDAARIRGGAGALAAALAGDLPGGTLVTNAAVTAIDIGPTCRLHCADGGTVAASAIIPALPPRLAAALDWRPALAPDLRTALNRHPTWMAAHAKIVATYDRAFWREAGLSGATISQRGPLMEIADHSTPDGGTPALFGFVGLPAEARAALGRDGLLSAVREQLARLFGPAGASPAQMHLLDWSTEPFTATPEDRVFPSAHPLYGDPLLECPWAKGRLAFAGAETSRSSGGLIGGAMQSGERAARLVAAALDAAPDRAVPTPP